MIRGPQGENVGNLMPQGCAPVKIIRGSGGRGVHGHHVPKGGAQNTDAGQAAESTGDWTLVGCTVSPGFDFIGFTLAEPGFTIPEA